MQRGELFSPPCLMHAERFCMQEAKLHQHHRKKCTGGGQGSCTWRSRDDGLLAGLRWRRWQRLSSRWLSNGPATSPSVRLLLFQLFESPLGFNYSKLLNPGFSVAVSEVLWFLSLLRSLSLSLSRVFFSFLRVALLFSSFFSSPFFFGFFSIYRGKVLGPMVVGSGCRGWLNHPRQPGAVFFSLSAGGRPTTSVGGPTVWGLGLFGGEVRERERREVFQSFSFLLLQVRGGRKTMNSVVQNDTVLSPSFFFLIYYIYR